MLLYVDISEFLKTRLTTGIQRVIREFLQRAMFGYCKLNIIYFNTDIKKYQLLDYGEISEFLKDIKNYQFTVKKDIDLLLDINSQKNKIFFDIDSVWNAEIKREDLYKKLKQNNFKIFNFIYDLTPVLLPDLARETTKTNFPSFILSVFEYSDFVFFDSISAQSDFFALKQLKNFTREISSKVIHLGSDFLICKSQNNNQHSQLLSQKYILFVGTIEPRKSQSLVLEAFEELHAKYLDLHLVLIGSIGWKVEDFVQHLKLHSLKDKFIHHLTRIDDETLSLFYQNAFLVTYISQYEGYGLPIAESLQHANITIASNNSSMIEVGKNYADYIPENTKVHLVDVISLYLDNQSLYNQKKQYIKKHYKPHNWDDFYNAIMEVLNHHCSFKI